MKKKTITLETDLTQRHVLMIGVLSVIEETKRKIEYAKDPISKSVHEDRLRKAYDLRAKIESQLY